MTDIEAQAEWLSFRLTKKDHSLIDSAENIPKEAREPYLRVTLGAIAKNHQKKIAKAIDRGECSSTKYPDLRTQKKRDIFAMALMRELGMEANNESN